LRHSGERARPSPGGIASGVALAVAVAAIVAWSLAPAVWQVLTALKPDRQITSAPTVYLPAPPTGEHFRALWERKPFGTYLANSLGISAAATALSVLLAALAAASLVRLPPARRDALLLGLLFLALFPPILLLFPLYEGARLLGWINHPLALVLPYAALSLPLAVWILESAYRQIPREIEEAALLDGLGPLARVRLIHLPLAAPSIATAAILVFIFCWNEFMLSLTFMTRDSHKTVTAGIASVGGGSIYEIPWGQLSAAVVIATAPLLALVLLFERRITSGLTRGAVKG
jgi:multiple sugar transport system permease protein